MRRCRVGLLSVLLLGYVTSAWSRVLTLANGGIVQLETLPGVPKWHLYPHLWSYINVNVSCPHKQVCISTYSDYEL